MRYDGRPATVAENACKNNEQNNVIRLWAKVCANLRDLPILIFPRLSIVRFIPKILSGDVIVKSIDSRHFGATSVLRNSEQLWFLGRGPPPPY